jgi:hypothetical protein
MAASGQFDPAPIARRRLDGSIGINPAARHFTARGQASTIPASPTEQIKWIAQ